MLTGESLYSMYVSAMYDQGVIADEWKHLEPTDHRTWNAMAQVLQLKEA